jgi:hypothetical protein
MNTSAKITHEMMRIARFPELSGTLAKSGVFIVLGGGGGSGLTWFGWLSGIASSLVTGSGSAIGEFDHVPAGITEG